MPIVATTCTCVARHTFCDTALWHCFAKQCVSVIGNLPDKEQQNTLHDLRTQVQGAIVAIENQKRRCFGLQYHPEVRHSDKGMETLKHFLFGIAQLKADWKLENILDEELEKLRQQVIAASSGVAVDKAAAAGAAAAAACGCVPAAAAGFEKFQQGVL